MATSPPAWPSWRLLCSVPPLGFTSSLAACSGGDGRRTRLSGVAGACAQATPHRRPQEKLCWAGRGPGTERWPTCEAGESTLVGTARKALWEGRFGLDLVKAWRGQGHASRNRSTVRAAGERVRGDLPGMGSRQRGKQEVRPPRGFGLSPVRPWAGPCSRSAQPSACPCVQPPGGSGTAQHGLCPGGHTARLAVISSAPFPPPRASSG